MAQIEIGFVAIVLIILLGAGVIAGLVHLAAWLFTILFEVLIG